MAKGNPHRRPQRIAQTRTRTRLQKPKLSDPVQNSQDLAVQLRSLGLYPAPTLGDGNCLFRALSDQLYGTPSHHLALRAEICAWMERDPARYQGFVDDDRSFEDHVRCMKVPGTYGGHLELSAFAHLKRRNVKVVQPGLVYVIEWDAGGTTDQAASSGESSASGSGAHANATEERDKRRMRREKKREEAEADASITQGTVYVAYHDWEHFSSVRNLTGPHTGLPSVVETPLPDSPTTVTAFNPPPSPSNAKIKLKVKSRGSKGPGIKTTITAPTPTATEIPLPRSRSSSPTTTSASASASSTTTSSLAPITPPDGNPAINMLKARAKGRSPKRSLLEADDGLAPDEEGRSVNAKRRGSSLATASTLGDLWESDMSPALTPSPSPSSASSSAAPSPPPSTTAVRTSSSANKMTRRQRKLLGVPKTRRVILTVGGSRVGKEVDKEKENKEWLENGSGRVDVRGFRELKI